MYRPGRLYCFSPPIMILTFVIELGIACYVAYRYRMSVAARLTTALLVLLATFQLAEFMVCEGALGLSSLGWARIGYVAITLLPPIGLHLGMQIARRTNRPLLMAAYGSGIAFAVFFMFVGHGMQGNQCLGNYVIFQVAPASLIPYTMYYYGWLVASVAIVMGMAKTITSPARRSALRWLAAGYASFIVPTTLVNIVQPDTIAGIPSIMCGFAVILAVIILFKVAPQALDAHPYQAPKRSKA